MKKNNKVKMPAKNALQLFLCAFIWGTAFVAQSVGMDYMGPFTFNGIRTLLGALVLFPIVLFRFSGRRKDGFSFKRTVLSGMVIGVVLCAASSLQQMALQTTEVGKAGFITAMYIIIVPVISFILTRKSSLRVWCCAGIALVGMYLLCMSGQESASFTGGDLELLFCAFLFSLHIILVEKLGAKADGIELSFVQFLTAGVVGTVCAFLFEQPSLAGLQAGMVPILYSGVMSCGIAYTLQIVGQKGADPTIASLIMSLESVISLLAGWVILGQALSVRELIGCGLMFFAIILVQLPEKSKQGEGVTEGTRSL